MKSELSSKQILLPYSYIRWCEPTHFYNDDSVSSEPAHSVWADCVGGPIANKPQSHV